MNNTTFSLAPKIHTNKHTLDTYKISTACEQNIYIQLQASYGYFSLLFRLSVAEDENQVINHIQVQVQYHKD